MRCPSGCSRRDRPGSSRHPDWEFRVWRLEDLTWLRNRSLFDRAETYAQKADIARYEVVHRFGGVYLDTDMECLRPLDTLLDGCEFFAGRQHDGIVAIAIFGAAPSHPILRQIIERLPASCFFHRTSRVSDQTGSHLLDRIIEGRCVGRVGKASASSLPSTSTRTGLWSLGARRQDSPRAFAVHHWDYSWRGGGVLQATHRTPSPAERASPPAPRSPCGAKHEVALRGGSGST